MENNFFEKAITFDQIRSGDTEATQDLAKAFYENCKKGENLAVEFVAQQHMPVLNQFSRIDNPQKFSKSIAVIKSRRKTNNASAHAIYLVGVTDLLVCSVLNNELVVTLQKVKDKTKVSDFFSMIKLLWREFFVENHMKFDTGDLSTVLRILNTWKEMLSHTDFRDSLSSVIILVNDAITKQKFLTTELPVQGNSKVNIVKCITLECKTEELKSKIVTGDNVKASELDQSKEFEKELQSGITQTNSMKTNSHEGKTIKLFNSFQAENCMKLSQPNTSRSLKAQQNQSSDLKRKSNILSEKNSSVPKKSKNDIRNYFQMLPAQKN